MVVEQQEKIEFTGIEWDTSGPAGCRLRAVPAHDGTVWNAVEYDAGASRSAWCSRSHYGVVLEGQLTFEFEDGGEISASAWEGYLIPGNRPHRGRNRGAERARAMMIDLPDAAS